MRNLKLLSILILTSYSLDSFSQHFNKVIQFKQNNATVTSKTTLEKPAFVLPVNEIRVNQNYQSPQFKTHSIFNHEANNSSLSIIETNQFGFVSRFEGTELLTTRGVSVSEFWKSKIKTLAGLSNNPNVDFGLEGEQTDELGIQHIRYQELFDGKPVYNSQYLVHIYPGQKVMGHGEILLPQNKMTPQISSDQAINIFEQKIGPIQKENAVSEKPAFLRTGVEKNELVYYYDQAANKWLLVYHLIVKTTPVTRWESMIDAQSGIVVNSFENLCKFHKHNCTDHSVELLPVAGPETTIAKDLFNIDRNLNVWREGSFLYLLDASRSMYNAAQSKLDDPVGAIWTIDALNTSPTTNAFNYDQIKSSNNTWFKNGISAHFNGGLAYLYFLNVHNRNSINGKGGSIISLINVAEENGRSMDNAFWNGEAMFYGNGDKAFTTLAKALDVAGHEMSHGVIQSTANLNYQGESGAINESFADIFGAMIDRDDWKMGEDVVIRTVFPSGALRDLSDPHNGSPTGGNGWQPRNVSEQYRGSADNGGVHINSGITNYAFYLFVQELAKGSTEEIAKKTAEKIYYRALAQYLSRSSQFKDLRNAIEQSCKDLHGVNSPVLTAAQKAFDAVGIGGTTGGGGGGGGSTSYQNDLPVNPGKQFIIATDQSQVGVYIVDVATNQINQISNQTIISKPSVTDNGREIYFVNDDNELIALFFDNATSQFKEFVLDNTPVYRNAVISKDGRLLAVTYNREENIIHVYDFVRDIWKDNFILTNPTYSDGVSTSNVRYADFMDFEHGGEYLLYDGLSRLNKSGGGSYEYWDIGFLRVWDRSKDNFGDGKIQKLFSKIPENSSIGNPIFSKNSPYIIAFDFASESNGTTKYQIAGMNVETNTNNQIIGNLNFYSYPSFSVKDDILIYDDIISSSRSNINQIPLAANKISSSGQSSIYFNEGKWASWIAFGTRRLIPSEDLKTVVGIEVFPNPGNEFVEIELDSKEGQDLDISIVNITGQQVLASGWTVLSGKNYKRISTDNLHSGMYIISIRNKNGQTNFNWIKK